MLVTDDLIFECVNVVWEHYTALGGTDQVAKGIHLTNKVYEAYKMSIEDALRGDDTGGIAQ